jgi:hypothetical protein
MKKSGSLRAPVKVFWGRILELYRMGRRDSSFADTSCLFSFPLNKDDDAK